MVSASSTSKTVVTASLVFLFLFALFLTGAPSEPRFSCFSPSLNLHRDPLISLLQFQNHQSIMPESLTKIYSILNFICLQAVKGCIWMFEQEQEQALGFSSVSTNIRMTVIKLKSGGLWVHAPISPTKECIQLIKELGAPVEYIVLPTFAYEHKIFVGPFSRKFPKAQVWVAPRQWNWPLNLPLEFLGIFGAKIIKDGDLSTQWAEEIEQKVLLVFLLSG